MKRKNSDNENLFVEIHAEWLMTERDDLREKTPRESLLEKQDFIDADLHSRFLQWSFTKRQPPPISSALGHSNEKTSNYILTLRIKLLIQDV